MPSDWRLFREQMPVARKLAYLDHAAVAPLSAAAREALRQYADEATAEGDTVWPHWAARVEQVRRTAAGMLNADPDEVAFVPNTTSGIHLVAEGFPWTPGDNVVVPENEFPSNLFPWLNLADRGVETRRVPVESNALGKDAVDIDRLLEACDPRTRLVTASWVGYASGWRLDIEQLVARAHARGIFVFLDAIQGLGVFPLDVRRVPVDFVAADGHKWMLGPEGAGLFYLRREHLDRLRPLLVGWNSVVRAHDFGHAEFQLRPSAARYEGGSQNMGGVAALGASLDLLVELGLSASQSPLADRILELVGLAADRLSAIGAKLHGPDPSSGGAHRSGILSFGMPGRDPQELRRHCLDAGVVLSCRDGRLRISLHAYNDLDDIERLVTVLGRQYS